MKIYIFYITEEFKKDVFNKTIDKIYNIQYNIISLNKLGE